MTDELSPRARQIIDRARDADEPTDADRTRVRAAVMAAISASAVAGSASAATGASSGATGAAAKGIGAASVASGGAGAKLALVAAVTAAAAAGGYAALSGSPGSSGAGADTAPAMASQPADSKIEPPTPAPAEVIPEPPPAEPAESDEPELEFAPDPVTARRTPARALSTIQAERSLLTDARRERQSGNPRAALTLLDAYSREFSGGKLLEERAALRVLVLCDLGDTTAATRQAVRFRAKWPESVQANRVNRSCAGGPTE